MMATILVCLAAILGWLAGRRFEVGRREIEVNRLEAVREKRGRRGTVRLNSMRIRR